MERVIQAKNGDCNWGHVQLDSTKISISVSAQASEFNL